MALRRMSIKIARWALIILDVLSDAFLSIVDFTASDWLFVNDSSVASSDLLSFMSMTGSAQSEIVNVRVDNLDATDIGHAVLQFVAQTHYASRQHGY